MLVSEEAHSNHIGVVGEYLQEPLIVDAMKVPEYYGRVFGCTRREMHHNYNLRRIDKRNLTVVMVSNLSPTS